MSALPGLDMLAVCAWCGTHRGHADPREPDCMMRREFRDAGERLAWPRIGLRNMDYDGDVYGEPAQVPQGAENWDRFLERAPRSPSVQRAWRVARSMLQLLPPRPVEEEAADSTTVELTETPPAGPGALSGGKPAIRNQMGPRARYCGAACRKRASRARQTA